MEIKNTISVNTHPNGSSQFQRMNGGEKPTPASPLATPFVSGAHQEKRDPVNNLSSQDRTSRPSASSLSSNKSGFTLRILEKVITVSLVAIFLGLPLLFTGMTLQGIAFEKELYFYFWLLIGVVSWVSSGVISGEMKIRKTPLDIPLLVFFSVYVLSAFFSVDKWHSFWGAFGDPSRGVLSIAALIVAYYFVLSHFTLKRFLLMFWSLLIAAFIMIIWSLLVAFGIRFLPASLDQYVPLSLMGTFGALLVFLGLTPSLFIVGISKIQSHESFAKATKTILSLVLFVGLALNLFLLLTLFSWVSWIAVIIGFAFFLVYILSKVVAMDDRLTWLPMVVLVLILAFYMAGPVQFVKTNLPIEATPNLKLSWEVAKSALKERTFLGSGPGTYGYNFSLYYPQEYNLQPLGALRFFQGSGIFFETAATLGVVGLLALIVLTLSFLSVGLYLLAQGASRDKLFSLGLWSAALVILVSVSITQVNGPLLLLGAMILTLAMGSVMRESQTEESYLHLSLQSSPKFALALAFVFLVVSAGVAFTFAFIGKAFWADIEAAKAMKSPSGSEQGLGDMAKAMQSMTKESRYASYLGQMYLTLANLEAKKPESERKVDTIKNSLASGANLMKLSVSQSPNDIVLQEALAQSYESALLITGASSAALSQTEEAYQRASALEPNNPVFYVKLGQVKKTLANSAKGDERNVFLSDAKSLMEKAIEKKPDLPISYLNLGLVEEALGETDSAIKTFAKGVTLEKGSVENVNNVSDLKYNLARLLRMRGKEEDMKLAEALLKEVIAADARSINAHLNLGLLYEQMNRKEDAIASYQKILNVLEGSGSEVARKQVQTFIDNIKAGKVNQAEGLTAEKAPSQETSQAEIPKVETQNSQELQSGSRVTPTPETKNPSIVEETPAP